MLLMTLIASPFYALEAATFGLYAAAVCFVERITEFHKRTTVQR